jgi:DNA-binding NarL/FixJ family response regulator
MNPPEKNGTRLRILVLGDDTLCREGLCRLLSELPCEVEIDRVDSIDDLQEDLREEQYDLIFLGVLPLGSDYAAAVRSVKELVGRTPVAALALVDTPSVVRGAIGAGASGFVPTTSSPRVILHAVELMLSGGVYLPPSVLGTGSSETRPREALEANSVRLTRRQEAVLRELAKGQSNKQIASALGLSEATVKVHIAAIMKSLKAQNRTHAVLTATQVGILSDAGM